MDFIGHNEKSGTQNLTADLRGCTRVLFWARRSDPEEVPLALSGQVQSRAFFWGSFDLAVTCFSGRAALLPKDVDAITREAYSHEEISWAFGRVI